jgi:hypothetical protein
MIMETAFMSASVSVLKLLQCFPVAMLCVSRYPDGCMMRIPAPPSLISLVADPFV